MERQISRNFKSQTHLEDKQEENHIQLITKYRLFSIINRFCVLLYYEYTLGNISPQLLTWSYCYGTETTIKLTYDSMIFLTSSADVVRRDPRTGRCLEVM